MFYLFCIKRGKFEYTRTRYNYFLLHQICITMWEINFNIAVIKLVFIYIVFAYHYMNILFTHVTCILYISQVLEYVIFIEILLTCCGLDSNMNGDG